MKAIPRAVFKGTLFSRVGRPSKIRRNAMVFIVTDILAKPGTIKDVVTTDRLVTRHLMLANCIAFAVAVQFTPYVVDETSTGPLLTLKGVGGLPAAV